MILTILEIAGRIAMIGLVFLNGYLVVKMMLLKRQLDIGLHILKNRLSINQDEEIGDKHLHTEIKSVISQIQSHLEKWEKNNND